MKLSAKVKSKQPLDWLDFTCSTRAQFTANFVRGSEHEKSAEEEFFSGLLHWRHPAHNYPSAIESLFQKASEAIPGRPANPNVSAFLVASMIVAARAVQTPARQCVRPTLKQMLSGFRTSGCASAWRNGTKRSTRSTTRCAAASARKFQSTSLHPPHIRAQAHARRRYFYYQGLNFHVLFKACKEEGAASMRAFITSSSTALRKKLSEEGVDFSMPNRNAHKASALSTEERTRSCGSLSRGLEEEEAADAEGGSNRLQGELREMESEDGGGVRRTLGLGFADGSSDTIL